MSQAYLKIRNYGIRLFYIVLLCLPVTLAAQNLSINATFDSTEILVGDQLFFNLESVSSSEISVTFPSLKDTLSAGIEIIEEKKADTIKKEDGTIRIMKRYLVTSFDSGMQSVRSLPFIYSMNGRIDTLSTLPVMLMVNTITLNDTATVIKEIKAPYKAPITFKESLPYVGYSFIALLLLLILLYYFYARKKNKPFMRFEKLKEPPYTIALKDLDHLKEQKLWQQGNLKGYYTNLTDILRVYFEGRFAFQAMEQTSDDILLDFKKCDTEAGLDLKLKEILEIADLVKFAKAEPLAEENERCIESAYSIVLKTKPKIDLSSEVSDVKI